MRYSLVLVVTMAAFMSSPSFAAGSYDPPPNADDRLKKAIKHIDRERYDRAISELRKAAKLRPNNADIQNYLGFAYRKSGKLEESGRHYTKALDLDPDHKGALEYQGELFLMTGKPEKAQANLARLVTLCPGGCSERADLEAAIAAAQ
tara:strand:+ start:1408 stop:1851 length:444 start_codon:yes stop_codon:yes gene_type:complete